MIEWLCEIHPEEEMGHDGCNGAGIPRDAQIYMLVIQRRNAIQKYNNSKWFYEDVIFGLEKRIEELEVKKTYCGQCFECADRNTY